MAGLMPPVSGNQVTSRGNFAGNAQLLRPIRSSKRWQDNASKQKLRCRTNTSDSDALTADPEAKFKRYGAHFGAKYNIDLNELMGTVPRVRMRQSTDRQKSQLADLALVNERLAGNESWEIRQKLEHLKSKRKNWEFIYEYVTKLDAIATLARIEEANVKVNYLVSCQLTLVASGMTHLTLHRQMACISDTLFSLAAQYSPWLLLSVLLQVQQLLSEEAQERTSVADLQHQLVDLQAEVNAAHEQLHLTQARVDQNVQRVADLKSEAAQMELMRHLTQADSDAQAQPQTSNQHHERISAHASASTSTATQTQAASRTRTPSAAARSAPMQRSTPTAMSRGLQSSLDIEEGLKNFWYPATFSSQLLKDTPVAFELFGQPWVLFRTKSGEPACVRDTCAHRACPLSLGKVIDGNIQCAYHGWQYDERGQCVSMPSTISCPIVGVSSMSCKETVGFVLVWPGEGQEPAVPSLAPPAGFTIHAEIEVHSSVTSLVAYIL